jgi:CelD/BcsL family acetyltransferase involved in cellulose biosynthesis
MIFEQIDFSNIHILEILKCDQTAKFLRALTTTFSAGPCKLAKLKIGTNLRTAKSDIVPAVESLLCSFTGLVDLFVNTGYPMISED